MGNYYNRYKKFIFNGLVQPQIPFIEIPILDSDLYITYNKHTMRMDVLSYKYYGDANLGWLILQANPSLGGYEFSIEDGVTLRIPYPKDSAITRYEESCNKYLNLKDI